MLLSQVAMDMWSPVFGKTSHFPPAEQSSTVDCPVGTTQQGPCLQAGEYMVRGRHEGRCPRGSLFWQLCSSIGPCSLPASYMSPPALSFSSLPDVFPV